MRDHRRDGVDAAGTQEDEAGPVSTAVLEQVDGAPEVVVEKFFGARLAIHSGEDAGVGSAIQKPVRGRKVSQILLVADIPHPDIDTECAEWLEVGLTTLANEAVDAGDPDTGKMLKQAASNNGTGETTNSSNNYFHEFFAAGGTRFTKGNLLRDFSHSSLRLCTRFTRE